MTILYIGRNVKELGTDADNNRCLSMTSNVTFAEKEGGVLVEKKVVDFGHDHEAAKAYFHKVAEEHPEYILWS